MLKTTRNKEKKQTKPSKTLVPIIRNRIKLKDGSAFSRIALLRRHPSIEQKSAYDLSVAIHKATSFKRVSDALRSSFHKRGYILSPIKKSGKRKGDPAGSPLSKEQKRSALQRFHSGGGDRQRIAAVVALVNRFIGFRRYNQ